MDIDGMLPLPLTAQRLRLRRDQVEKLLFTGQLVGRKIGARWFISTASVDQYQQAHLEEVTSP